VRRALAAGAVCLAAWHAAAAVLDGDAARGQALARSERCLECHSTLAHGASPGTLACPKLAGQARAYLVKQLLDFRNGERRHTIMTVMAAGLREADVADIASYFGSLPPMHGDGSGELALARTLFLEGDAPRGIPACAQCHGPAGQGATLGGVTAPRIGGQDRPYLEFQLRDWREGVRANSTGALMNRVARDLTDAEIEALAGYVSGLQPPAVRDGAEAHR
jgi:cytochrome c553